MKLIYLFVPVLILGCSTGKETKRDRFFLQGNESLAHQDFDQAVDFYTKSLENDPNFASAYNNRGVARIEDGHSYEAIQDYNQAIAINPDYYEAIFNRAYAYENIGKISNALEDVSFLEGIFPDSAYIYFYKGLLLTTDRQYKSGIRQFQKAINLDTSNMDAYVNLATLYFYQNQVDSSRFWLRYILKRQPNEPNVYNTLSQIYLAESDYQNALITINQALNIVPQEPYFLNNRGQVYLEMKDYEKALKDINKSILLDPKNAWAFRNKGIYHLSQKNYNEAIKLMNDALKRNKFIDEIYSYLGEAFMGKGDMENACNAWKQGVALNEKRSINLYQANCR
ncbi:MAG: tetratricopeptide (TPR) repeat protein [Cyclobacteriaceae bacterium]|jgi:tetratricopeptide (TPR) repeat protein